MGHTLQASGTVNFTSAIPKSGKKWGNSKPAIGRTRHWWVRSPLAISGQFAVGVDTDRHRERSGALGFLEKNHSHEDCLLMEHP